MAASVTAGLCAALGLLLLRNRHRPSSDKRSLAIPIDAPRPLIVITYCHKCKWLLRASWLSQELLNTFGTDLRGVQLQPGDVGVFHIVARTENGLVGIWDRKEDGGFPQAKELKRRLRSRVLPQRQLGKCLEAT